MLETLSISIEKERPVWGYHHIAGATAEAKINTLWHTFPHEEFLEALFYLADHKHSSSILNLLIKEEANEMISSYLLNRIVKHGLITRKDSRENIDKLESKFFPQSKKAFLIERRKNSKK